MLLLSLAFGLVGWWSWCRGLSVWWIGAAFCLLGAPLALIQLLPGAAYVEASPDGLVTCSLFRRHVTPWTDIKGFFVIVLGRRPMVAIAYHPDAARPRLRTAAQALTGVEGVIPRCALDPDRLAGTLNAILAAQQAAAGDEPQAARR